MSNLYIHCPFLYNTVPNIDELPVLDTGSRVGMTDYIDFITEDEMKYPVMRGVDVYRRPFISVRVTVTKPSGDTSKAVGTFFQRYTDAPQAQWCFGTCYPIGIITDESYTNRERQDKLENRLRKLFNGETLNTMSHESSSFNIDDYWVPGYGDSTVVLG